MILNHIILFVWTDINPERQRPAPWRPNPDALVLNDQEQIAIAEMEREISHLVLGKFYFGNTVSHTAKTYFECMNVLNTYT
jgi:uncharacterized protein (DUF849 family)